MLFSPGLSPNISPIATRVAGAICTITFLFGLVISFHTFSTSDLIVKAPVGHTAAHCPQFTQSTCPSGLPFMGCTTVLAPLFAKPNTECP